MFSNCVSVSEIPAAPGSATGAYDGRHVALLTQHGKERVIGPVLDRALGFARECGFPEHYLVVRPESESDPRIRKGIHLREQFREALAWAQSESNTGQVFLETDVRTHANPTRMHVIRQAAEDLAKRIASLCPACGTPGYWIVEHLAGLQCASCGAPTRQTRADVLGCVTCVHGEQRDRTDPPFTDPSRCDYCNP